MTKSRTQDQGLYFLTQQSGIQKQRFAAQNNFIKALLLPDTNSTLYKNPYQNAKDGPHSK